MSGVRPGPSPASGSDCPSCTRLQGVVQPAPDTLIRIYTDEGTVYSRAPQGFSRIERLSAGRCFRPETLAVGSNAGTDHPVAGHMGGGTSTGLRWGRFRNLGELRSSCVQPNARSATMSPVASAYT